MRNKHTPRFKPIKILLPCYLSAPISNANILWGGAATALLGATLAEWQRKRAEEEAARLAALRNSGGGDEGGDGGGRTNAGRKAYQAMMQEKRIVGSLQAEQNAKAAQTQAASQRAKDDYRAGEKAYDIAQASTQNTGGGKPLAIPVPVENRVTDKEREEAMTAYREGERNAVSIAEEYKSQVREEANLSHREGERDAMEAVREYATQSYREGEREAVSIAEQARLNAVDAARWAGVASVAQGQQEEKKPWWEQIAQTWNETIATPVLNIWNTTSKQITNAWNFVTTPIVNAWDTATRVVKDVAVDVFRFFYNARGEDLVKVSEDEILRSPEKSLWKTYIAAGINVQREGINLGGYTSGKGPAQLSQQQLDTPYGKPYYSDDCEGEIKAKCIAGYGVGVDGSPYNPNVAVDGMTNRIEQVLKFAENQSTKRDINVTLDETDRFIITALSQNGPGFDKDDISTVLKEYSSDGRIDWKGYFENEYETWPQEKKWLERTVLEAWQWIKTGEGGKDFNTEFSLELYYQEMRALESQGYPFPEGLDIQRIEELMNTSKQAQQEGK